MAHLPFHDKVYGTIHLPINSLEPNTHWNRITVKVNQQFKHMKGNTMTTLLTVKR